MKQSHKTILLWALLIGLFVLVYDFMATGRDKPKETDVTEITAALKDEQSAKKIEKIVAHKRAGDTDAKFVVHYKDDSKKHFRTEYSDSLTNQVVEANEKFGLNIKTPTVQEQSGSFWQSVIISWLPMLFLLFVFIFFMRQLQSGGGKAMNFGKAKAKLMTENQNRVTFKDVAGVEEAKEEVQEIIDFLKDPKKFTRLGGRIPKGVLMMGPPGTGKTLLARAIAGEAGVPFFSISGSDFVEMFVGVGASRVRDLFEQGKKNAPCIIFIDEIDAVGRHRGAGLGGGHDEREQTLNQLLVEMDGFESNDGVILVAATNRPDVLDPALLRPGRFDRRIIVPRPDVGGRIGILNVHVRKVPVADEVDIKVIARGTPGFSGADLANLVNEAALIAARHDKDVVEMEDFEEAKDKVLMGAERRSAIIPESEKRTTAYHEAGHALVAKMVEGHVDPVHKVTIIPRGQALGLMQQLPEQDHLATSKEFALNRIAIAMGGRAAEEIIFSQRTSGASSDIQHATDVARRMVTEWGMSDEIGPLNFSSGGREVFLGREVSQGEAFSQETAKRIDAEIRRIVSEENSRAVKILTDNRDILEAIAEALLQYETLDGKDIDKLCRGENLDKKIVTEFKKAPDTSGSKAKESPAGPEEEDDEPTNTPTVPALSGGEPEPA